MDWSVVINSQTPMYSRLRFFFWSSSRLINDRNYQDQKRLDRSGRGCLSIDWCSWFYILYFREISCSLKVTKTTVYIWDDIAAYHRRLEGCDCSMEREYAKCLFCVVITLPLLPDHGVRKKDGGVTQCLLTTYFWLGRVVFPRRR